MTKPETDRQPDYDDHEHRDGCLCGHEIAEHEATGDHDLPEATGGVAGDPKPRKPRRRGTRAAVAGEA